ncbi:MAG: DNA-directed RNA polymerase subunit beta', partial [Candidatus Delongbacteria bacterium]|nr:DNA-directed RNA polymerase subunit beta' [Candidatus Delongbacteria bacterium]
MFKYLDNKKSNPSGFRSLEIKLASPDVIRKWSYGEVTKPETINYRTFKPEKGGLFCEQIFGPVKDWECSCGKYKRIRYKGVICDRCGVEVTLSKVRRERMGHIELAVPVSHIWYLRSNPSRIGYLLNLSIPQLERVIYYESYVVIDPGNTDLEQKQLIPEEEYLKLKKDGKQFTADMGAGAIRKLLSMIDIEELSAKLRTQAKVETSVQRREEAFKRLQVVEAFLSSTNKPESMILSVIPVLPPELRPLVPLEGGRFASSDLNDLYRRLINRNNRLKKMMEIPAPEVILRNEKRMLQEAVDALFDNGKRINAVRGSTGNRPLKSLSDMLKGKQGRFRQNLLGKRVDYSGRTVIVVGPELHLYQCGLPKKMALELFKPFIIRELLGSGACSTLKSAKKMVEREYAKVWDILEKVITNHPVLLNRAPTLHRLGIQAFMPKLIEGKAIRIHPLVCSAFNADFDGDQMAVHIPLSFEAQIEASTLMLSANNILSPAHGKPLTLPSQDIVIGIYYLTKGNKDAKGKDRIISSYEEAEALLFNEIVDLHAVVFFKPKTQEKPIKTTIGRIIFNNIIPDEIGFINDLMNKKQISDLVDKIFRRMGTYHTVKFLDELKELGYKYATRSGLSIGVDDLLVPEEKKDIISKCAQNVDDITQQFDRGIITDGERYNKVIDIWSRATDLIGNIMMDKLKVDRSGFNPVFMMADSGARGSKEQIRQLAGMRGLMTKPQKKITGQIGEIIENPIITNFREGLSVIEYFISTHGARKGLADTALKTADAGYLTRRLVDVAQDVIVTEFDCGTIVGIEMSILKEGGDIIESLAERIIGRVALDDVSNPITDELIVEAGVEINEEIAHRIEAAGIDKVRIRSVLTCDAKHGVCSLCYGRNLATGKMVELGESVGVIAAQSIGEPGTQLTLRTFHIGGAASLIVSQSKVSSKFSGEILFKDMDVITNKENQKIVISRRGEMHILDADNNPVYKYDVPHGAVLYTDNGESVKEGQMLFESEPFSSSLITDIEGQIRFYDMIENVSIHEETSEITGGKKQTVIIESRDRSLHPRIEIINEKTHKKREFALPIGTVVLVNEGEKVFVGDIVGKIPKESSKTRDITGGLPRIAELFEARIPTEPAIISEVDGSVKYGKIVRGYRKLTVMDENAVEHPYSVPQGKHLLVHDGDFIKVGERICEGPINPHDILFIQGVQRVQEYL